MHSVLPVFLRMLWTANSENAVLLRKTHDWKPQRLAPGDNPLAEIHHDLLDIELELELLHATQVRLVLRGEEIRYEAKTERLHAFGRSVALAPSDGSFIIQ